MNIASFLNHYAQKTPDKRAVTVPQFCHDEKKFNYEHITFSQLNALANHYAFEFQQLGITKGMKVTTFIRPSFDFPAVIFALFKLGAVPVLIDPGMGRTNLINTIAQIKPKALIAAPEVHLLRLSSMQTLRSLEIFITTKRTWGIGTSLEQLKKKPWQNFGTTEVEPTDAAAILFTSGATGVPKGVIYTHEIFINQIKLLQKTFSLTELDIDLPGFPLFSLFTISMGMNSCLPKMNPSKPATANPKKIIDNIKDNSVTFAAGSPAIWERVADYCLDYNIKLDTVKYLVMFGAPVPIELHQKFAKILSLGTTYTPYGATEALPITNISGKDILENTATRTAQGRGTCVGLPIEGTKIKIVHIKENRIRDISNIEILKTKQIGEIIVCSNIVTKQYLNMPYETALAKIKDGDKVWHRMGDVGYLDKLGQLWFCGRKKHLVKLVDEQLFSVQCEAIFNQHSEVKRTALVGIRKYGKEIPVIVVERLDGNHKIRGPKKIRFEKELLKLGQEFSHTTKIQKIFYTNKFPVDVRHNIKIDRMKLRDDIEKNQ